MSDIYSIEEQECCIGFYDWNFLVQCEHRFWRSYHNTNSARIMNSGRAISNAAFSFLGRMLERSNIEKQRTNTRVEGPIPEILRYNCYRVVDQFDYQGCPRFPSIWIIRAGDGKGFAWESRVGNGLYEWHPITCECFPVQ